MWGNPTQAQQLMKQYNTLKAEVESWSAFSRRVQDAVELAQLDDEELRPELEAEITAIEAELEKRAFTAMLSGKYDHDSAILAIHAGAGGTDFSGLGRHAGAYVSALDGAAGLSG